MVAILSHSTFLAVKNLTSEEHPNQENTCVPSTLYFLGGRLRYLLDFWYLYGVITWSGKTPASCQFIFVSPLGQGRLTSNLHFYDH